MIIECLALDPDHRPGPAAVATRLRHLRAALDGLAPLPAVSADMVTWWPRAAEETAPVTAAVRRRAGWTSAAAPVSPASGDSPQGSGSALPIAALPQSPVVPVPPAAAPVSPAVVGVAPVSPLSALAPVSPFGAPDAVDPFGPLPQVTEPPARRRWRSRRAVAVLAGAAALVVALAGLSAFLLLGPGRHGEPGRPVAVTTPQSSPASTRPSTTPSPSGTSSPAPATDAANTGSGSGSGSGSGGSGSGGSGSGSGYSPTPTDGTIPGIGATMPTFPGR
jgi:hypothetical protein